MHTRRQRIEDDIEETLRVAGRIEPASPGPWFQSRVMARIAGDSPREHELSADLGRLVRLAFASLALLATAQAGLFARDWHASRHDGDLPEAVASSDFAWQHPLYTEDGN